MPPQGGQGHSPGTPLVPFVVKRKEPRVWAGQAHWWVLGLPAGAASPAKAPGVGGAERPPRNKHTPGTARQAVGARTKPTRELGAGSTCPLEQGWRNFCTNPAPRGRQLGPARNQYVNWAQAQPAANRVRHHAAAKWVQAQHHQIVSQQSNALSAREKLKQKAEPRTRIASRLSLVVEARGIEPLSENLSIRLSPSAVYRFCLAAASLCSAPANWRAASVDSSSSAVRDAPA